MLDERARSLRKLGLLALIVGLAACGRGSDGAGGRAGAGDERGGGRRGPQVFGSGEAPVEAAPAVLDLGVARYPADTRHAPVSYVWDAERLAVREQRIAYALDATEQESIGRAHLAFGKTVGFERRGKGFRWHPPPGCAADLRCVYETLLIRSERALAPIVELFRAQSVAGGWSNEDLAISVVAFVQHIPYHLAHDQPFGVLPPSLVVARQQGDCDSKVILAHGLLRALGIDSLVLSSRAHQHAMLGVALPTIGQKVRLLGRDYAYVEMTAENAPIGHVSAKLLSPNDWRVVPVRGVTRPGGAKKKGREPPPPVGPVKL